MIYNNILLEVRVSGDWRKSLDEAQSLAKQLRMPIRLNYMNQKIWIVDEYSNIEKMKEEKFMVGV